MSLRSIRRALNALLIVGALAIAAAVIIDIGNIGPRSHVDQSGATLVTSPVPVTEPPADTVVPVSTILRGPRACPSSKLMPFGGSLTAGVDSYRGPLMVSMNERRIPLDLVGSQTSRPRTGGDPNEEGYPGFVIGPAPQPTTKTLADVVDSTIKPSKPDVIVVLTGTDDLLDPVAANSLASSLTALVTRMKEASPASLIVLAELPPTVTHPASSPELVAYNTRAKRLADVDAFDSLFFAGTNAKLTELGWDPAVDLTADQREFTAAGGRKFTIAIEPVVAGAIVRDRSRRCVRVPKQRPTSSLVTTTLPQLDDSDFVIG